MLNQDYADAILDCQKIGNNYQLQTNLNHSC